MMAGIRAKDTKPEIVVRTILHSLGFRFRLHRRDLIGRPDMVLPRWNLAVFVHGCFWHGHEKCPLFRIPKTRGAFWVEKISKNKLRDAKVRNWYEASDWRYLEIWECALKGRSRLDQLEFQKLLSNTIKDANSASSEIRGHAAE